MQRVLLVLAERAGEAPNPSSKIFGDVLYSTIVVGSQLLAGRRPGHAGLPHSHDEDFATKVVVQVGVESTGNFVPGLALLFWREVAWSFHSFL